jgi:hypothetical protein
MRALSASELLDLWERGASRGPIGRALEMLAVAAPQIEAPHLVSIGRRDALLLALRERTFGPAIQAVTSCGSCGEEIELSFAAVDLGGTQEIAGELDVQIGAYRLRLRSPHSEDVAIALASGPADAEAALFERCAEGVWQGDVEIRARELPGEIASAAIERIAKSDPHAEIALAVTCPRCGSSERAIFDIVSFFWRELEAFAIRILREVHVLATAYGWDEARILEMSATRRRCYLEMVEA